MAIKKRLLKTVRKSRKMIGGDAGSDYENAVLGIKDAKELCAQGLPKNSFTPYAEIFEELFAALKEGVDEKISDLLKNLNNQIQNETNFKKEIFFLPYKASMWDSLEGVWKAAYEDKEHCIAYVMPIPYANRNPDMSLTKFRCERSQFPSYVPTLDWQETDLRAWHPDIIFYHNPYDYNNTVTSVMEKYYSVNLRLCADKLVYIPYFVTKNSVNLSRCNVSGVQNADYVIVQDEILCEFYKKNYVNQNECNKFLPLGSPKVDKVRNISKSQYPLPKDWENTLDAKKYVVFFNTTFHGWIRPQAEILQQLRLFFEAVSKSNEIVLWWRPHPLIESGLRAMHPQFADEYLTIKETYIKEKIGIYDELPDFYTAFAWTDAYYGDESSLYTLYQCMNKPARRINYEKNLDSDFDEAVTSLVDQIKNGLYAVERNINDTVPQNSGVIVYNFIKNAKEQNDD